MWLIRYGICRFVCARPRKRICESLYCRLQNYAYAHASPLKIILLSGYAVPLPRDLTSGPEYTTDYRLNPNKYALRGLILLSCFIWRCADFDLSGGFTEAHNTVRTSAEFTSVVV